MRQAAGHPLGRRQGLRDFGCVGGQIVVGYAVVSRFDQSLSIQSQTSCFGAITLAFVRSPTEDARSPQSR